MLIEGRDFGCSDASGVYACWPRTSEAAQIYHHLQRLAGVPEGKISATTTLAVQRVLAVLNLTTPLPAQLTPVVMAPDAVQAVRALATCADLVAAYAAHVLARSPHALTNPPAARAMPLSGSPAFPLRPVLYAVGGAAFLLGVGLVTHKASRRSAGVDDASYFLPPSVDDGTRDEEEA